MGARVRVGSSNRFGGYGWHTSLGSGCFKMAGGHVGALDSPPRGGGP